MWCGGCVEGAGGGGEIVAVTMSLLRNNRVFLNGKLDSYEPFVKSACILPNFMKNRSRLPAMHEPSIYKIRGNES